MRTNAALQRRDDRGFTLIELLVVIVIIGILAGIAIPIFLGQRTRAVEAQARSDLRNIGTAEQAYLTEAGTYLDTTTPASDLQGVRLSNQVQSVVVETLNSDGTKNGSNGADGFCAIAHTNMSSTYYYNSLTGGLTNTACP